jgi:hypothetical protein
MLSLVFAMSALVIQRNDSFSHGAYPSRCEYSFASGESFNTHPKGVFAVTVTSVSGA